KEIKKKRVDTTKYGTTKLGANGKTTLCTGSTPSFVIGPHFCASYPVDLVIVEKSFRVTEGNFDVTDIEGNLMFKVKGRSFFLAFHDRRLLIDAAGNHVVTLRDKHTADGECLRESTDAKNLLFSLRTPHVIQIRSNNSAEEVCDFRVEGSWTEKSCVVKAGESSTIIAQIETLGKDKFTVSVHPNVDYAFIVTLIMKEIGENCVPKNNEVEPLCATDYKVHKLIEISALPAHQNPEASWPLHFKFQTMCVAVDLTTVTEVMALTDGNFMVTDKWSMHSRWQVFRGDSRDDADLLFNTKRSEGIQLKMKLNITEHRSNVISRWKGVGYSTQDEIEHITEHRSYVISRWMGVG
ncbi:hypothetical protein RJ639_006001, partial [Escallonia herrerae]